MTEKTPQDEMRHKMSTMARNRAGRLVQPTMSELIQARKQKIEGGGKVKGKSKSDRREKTSAMRGIVTGGDGGKTNRTIRAKRKAQLKKLKPQKPKRIHMKRKGE